MKAQLNFLWTLSLLTFGVTRGSQVVTQGLNSDEDSVPPSTFNRPVYGVSQGTQDTQIVDRETQNLHADFKQKEEQKLEPEIDATFSRHVRYSAGGYNTGGYNTGGYNTGGYNSGGYNSGYGGGGYNSGWSGNSNPGYSSGGIVCTVCSQYDAANSQKCCAFGYRQCCNVGVHGHFNQIGGAGFTYVNPGNFYTSNAEKPGTCRSYSSYGHNSGRSGFVNQNAGFYATRRNDRKKREAGLATSSAYGPPYSNNAGYYTNYNSGSGYPSTGGTGGYQWGNGVVTTSTSSVYRPGYCQKDYECSGNQKCCSGFCENPVAYIG